MKVIIIENENTGLHKTEKRGKDWKKDRRTARRGGGGETREGRERDRETETGTADVEIKVPLFLSLLIGR